MELVNTHTHTVLSGHGTGTVEELVAAASAARVSTLAVTEHYPLSSAFDPDGTLSMHADAMAGYLEAIERASRVNPDVEVLAGCELDCLGADEDRSLAEADFEPFSLVLGSVHFIDGWAFDDPADVASWERSGAADRAWRRYFDLWCEIAAGSGPMTVMAHPDLVKKFGFYPSFDVAPLYERAAEACAAGGRMVEVNTSGAHYPCKEMYPAPDLLAAFCRAGVPCTVGTDAHDPRHVARGIEDAYRMMYACGYREVTVPTPDGDRRRIAIE